MRETETSKKKTTHTIDEDWFLLVQDANINFIFYQMKPEPVTFIEEA